MSHPKLSVVASPEKRNAPIVVIILPGGRANDRSPFRSTGLANLRMIGFGRVARRAIDAPVWRLGYRLRGWNAGPQAVPDPVRDVAWALDQMRERHPGARAILIGHSMGGRAALYAAGDPDVVAVCALAPWIEVGDPVEQLTGRTVLIAHGDRDRVTDPVLSQRFAQRAAGFADVRWVTVPGDGHAMLRRTRTWNRLVRSFLRHEVRDLGCLPSVYGG